MQRAAAAGPGTSAAESENTTDKIPTVSNSSKDTGPRASRPPHHVFTGCDTRKQLSLFISVQGKDIEEHICDRYHPDFAAGVLKTKIEGFTPKSMVYEHGWFGDPRIFQSVCSEVGLGGVQLGGTDDDSKLEAYKKWV